MESMLQESVNVRQNLHHRVLIAAVIVLAQDLFSGGGAQAWTYNYSTSPNRRWLEARQWCQQHFTDMVAIQNQEETDFLNNLLPFHPKYYWIGMLKIGEMWTWVGTKEIVPEDAPNWAPAEPDTIPGQDCVEMYIKREKDTAKWNNEKCRNKKGTVCYTVSCTQESCSAHADCVETIGNYTCRCHPGFLGPRCEEAEECPVLNHTNISGGNMNCSHPIAPHSYNSTCEVRCNEGYELSGQDQIRCDHTGQWTASVPACTVKKCSPIFFPTTGNMTCVDTVEPFSYGSECNFTCQEGFYLTGENMITCLVSGQWSKPAPACTAKRCLPINPPHHGSLSCSDPNGSFSFGSKCASTCEEGFLLNGTTETACTSVGMWSEDIPRCLAKRCPTLTSPPHGSLLCSEPHGEFSFGSRCTSTCEEGFVLNGTVDIECTSLGVWSRDIPHCLAKRCPTLNSPPHGSIVCSDPHGAFSFGSRCESTCEEGFIVNGTVDRECTSVGTWSTDIPLCLVKRCPTLNFPAHGTLTCSDPHGEFSFGSQCNSTCEDGFVLNGAAETECTSVGAWSAEIPRCTARPCPLVAKAPQHGTMNCSHPYSSFSYGSHCGFECNEGFWLRGTPAMTCNTSGHWSQNLPTCQLVQCEAIHALSLPLSMNCSHPLGNFSFGSQCIFTCKEGFFLNGTEVLFCSSTGFWSDTLPKCTVEEMSVGTAILLYTGVGVATAFMSLIGLALLIMKLPKKRGTNSMGSFGEVTENL
ncbi:hypothetical protein PAMP_024505 [Pampus punctatissimus]